MTVTKPDSSPSKDHSSETVNQQEADDSQAGPDHRSGPASDSLQHDSEEQVSSDGSADLPGEWPVRPEGYLAFCLAVKDQHADIQEWIEHHRAIGASK